MSEVAKALEAAAERVRRGIKSREEIPNFSERRDEIGHLARALRDMTNALYNRMDAIETFAADVSHELKNPLTSLRSAVETLPLARKPEARDRLMEIIQHDVRRLDRLITDISDASRLDAELARADAEPIDIAALLRGVADLANERAAPGEAPVVITIAPSRRDHPYRINGHDSRLAQVINNLIDNARSFSPPGAKVRIDCTRLADAVEITVITLLHKVALVDLGGLHAHEGLGNNSTTFKGAEFALHFFQFSLVGFVLVVLLLELVLKLLDGNLRKKHEKHQI